MSQSLLCGKLSLDGGDLLVKLYKERSQSLLCGKLSLDYPYIQSNGRLHAESQSLLCGKLSLDAFLPIAQVGKLDSRNPCCVVSFP